MSLEFMIYLFDVLGNLQGVAIFFSFLLAMLLVVMLALLMFAVDDRGAATRNGSLPELEARIKVRANRVVKTACAFVACVLLAALIPSTKTLYTIAAVSITKDAAQSEVGQKIIKRAEEWALEYLEPKKVQK